MTNALEEAEIRQILISRHKWADIQIDIGLRAGFHCEYCGRDLLASVDDYAM